MARRGSRVRQARTIKRIFRQLPDEMRKELADVLDAGGAELVPAIRARAPNKTGALRKGISYRVRKKRLQMLVGLLGTPKGRAKLFYGWIQEYGRKGQVVRVSRRRKGMNSGLVGGRKNAADIAATYSMRVRQMRGKKFVTGSYPDLRRKIGEKLRGVWDRVLNRLARSDGYE